MAEHERTYSWEDPAKLVDAWKELSGLDYVRAMVSGELPHPPICATVGFRLVEVDEGRCVAEVEPGEHQLNPLGFVHGSSIVAVLDSTAGSALHSTLPVGVGYATVALTTNFVRAIRADAGTLVSTGTLIKSGRRLGFAEARLTDGKDRLLAHATATCAILSP